MHCMCERPATTLAQMPTGKFPRPSGEFPRAKTKLGSNDYQYETPATHPRGLRSVGDQRRVLFSLMTAISEFFSLEPFLKRSPIWRGPPRCHNFIVGM